MEKIDLKKQLKLLYNPSASRAAVDYGVIPLEALRWTGDMSTFCTDNKGDWKWTLIVQPPFISGELVGQAMLEVKQKRTPLHYLCPGLNQSPRVKRRRPCTSVRLPVKAPL